MYMLHSNKKSIALVTETALHTVLTLSPLLIHFFFLIRGSCRVFLFNMLLGNFRTSFCNNFYEKLSHVYQTARL